MRFMNSPSDRFLNRIDEEPKAEVAIGVGVVPIYGSLVGRTNILSISDRVVVGDGVDVLIIASVGVFVGLPCAVARS